MRRLRAWFAATHPGGSGAPPAGHYEPAARSSLTEGANAPEKRGPEPVIISREMRAIAAVERREACALIQSARRAS